MSVIIKSSVSANSLIVDPTSLAARTTLYDTAGNAIGTEVDVDGHYNLHTSISQSVFASTKNSSTAQINAGATWEGPKTLVGGAESTLGIVGIQVNTFLDKKHTVICWQSIDGDNWDISDSFTHPGNYGSARTFQATGSYYYISVKNETAANTGVVRIQTALCPCVEALPRALTSGGNLKVTPQAEWQNNKLVTGLYALSTFRILGTAASPQNIFTIENPAASTVDIAVRGLNVATDSTAVLTTVAPMIKLSRLAVLPTGGTALTAVKYKTSFAAAGAICRGGNASDDGVTSAITATAGSALWTQSIDRAHTVVGWMIHPGYNLIPDVGGDLRQIILVPGESLLVQGVTAMAATTTIIVNCSWLEYTSV